MKIENPKEKTYFICREDDTYTIMSYGSVDPTQVMETSQPIVDIYLDKNEWESKLLESGIDLNEQNLIE